MTPERAKELLPIIAAFADGKTIQGTGADGVWHDLHQLDVETDGPFRIKPKPREVWINIYPQEFAYDWVCHPNKDHADAHADDTRTECVRFVEVLP